MPHLHCRPHPQPALEDEHARRREHLGHARQPRARRQVERGLLVLRPSPHHLQPPHHRVRHRLHAARVGRQHKRVARRGARRRRRAAGPAVREHCELRGLHGRVVGRRQHADDVHARARLRSAQQLPRGAALEECSRRRRHVVRDRGRRLLELRRRQAFRDHKLLARVGAHHQLCGQLVGLCSQPPLVAGPRPDPEAAARIHHPVATLGPAVVVQQLQVAHLLVLDDHLNAPAGLARAAASDAHRTRGGQLCGDVSPLLQTAEAGRADVADECEHWRIGYYPRACVARPPGCPERRVGLLWFLVRRSCVSLRGQPVSSELTA